MISSTFLTLSFRCCSSKEGMRARDYAAKVSVSLECVSALTYSCWAQFDLARIAERQPMVSCRQKTGMVGQQRLA